MCESCSTDVGESPETYLLCPECLTTIEDLLRRGLNRQATEISAWMPWAGAAIGALAVFTVWIAAMLFMDPTWLAPLRWIGYVSCALGGAVMAVRFSGNYRGPVVVAATLSVVALLIVTGHYISTNLLVASYLAENPALLHGMVESGAVQRDVGIWLPFTTVLHIIAKTTTWMDYGAMAAALFLAYSLTHRRRLWLARKRWFS
jgi:hypothetical protein